MARLVKTVLEIFTLSYNICDNSSDYSCSCERSFSKLSIFKKFKKYYMLQERLDDVLLFLFVEQELLIGVDFNDVIDEFKHLSPFIYFYFTYLTLKSSSIMTNV